MDWYPLWNSLRIALISCAAVFFLGIFAAYYIAKLPRTVKGVLDVVLTLPMVLPPTVVGYFLLLLFGAKRPLGIFFLEHFGVKLVMNWVSKDGKTISATPVNISVDYDKTNWFEQGGIYYYKTPVAPKDAKTGNVTSNLLKTPITQPESAPDGCHLEVTVLAESIQAAPSKAVTDSWHVDVDSNGHLMQPTMTPYIIWCALSLRRATV